MTEDRWSRIKQLFERARDAAPDERDRILAGEEEALTSEVQALLQAYDGSRDFLEEPALARRAGDIGQALGPSLAGEHIGPWRIVGPVGEGGMGVVYAGARDDGAVEQKAAIKILKRWMIGESDIVRFRAERQILAGLEHPYIARLLDGGTTADGLPYYAMEFVDGQFLDTFCRQRNLGERARLALFRQVCEAVEYAHAQGIVHRDLKPANILVTADGVPKLLDFGIAKVHDPTGMATRTVTLNRVATPQYASPEQLRGGDIGPSSDIYSLGVLLYELLTDEHPHGNARDSEPERPSRKAGRPEWAKDRDHVVLKALRQDPGERYASAAELAREIGRYLDRQPVLARSGSGIRAARRAFTRFRIPLAVAALVALAAGAGLWWGRHAPARTARRSLAVIGFQNLSGRADASWMATAISEMVATELAATERVRVVSPETVGRIRSGLQVSAAETYSRGDLDRLRTNLDVDYFVTGSYLAGDSLRVLLRLQEARTGRIAAAATETGSAAHLSSVVEEAIHDLLRESEFSAAAQGRQQAVLGAYANPVSARLYAQALERLRLDDARAAHDLLRQAAEADPGNPLVHSAYGEALRKLGYEDKQRAEAKIAFDLSAALPREQRLLVEARYRAAVHDGLRAVAIYRTLWDLFNDNIEYGLALARAQALAGKWADALATVAVVRSRYAGREPDPRIDLEESFAAGLQNDNKRSLEAASRAAATAGRSHARLAVADANIASGDALYELDRLEEARAAYQAAEAIYRDMGNSYGIGMAYSRQGRAYWKQGNYAASRQILEKARDLFREMGNQRAASPVVANLGLAIAGQGDREGSLAMMEQAIAMNRELGARNLLAGVLNNAGNILRRLNRPQEARRYFEECLALAVELNETQQMARSQVTLATLDTDDGNLIAAGDRLQQALTLAGNTDNMRMLILQHMGVVKRGRGDTDGGARSYQESLDIAVRIKAEQYAADTRVSLAVIAGERGDAPAAARLLGQARDYYLRQKQKTGLWEAQLAHARIQMSAGAPAGTEGELGEAAAGYRSAKAPAGETEACALLAESWLAQHNPRAARQAIAGGRTAFQTTREFGVRAEYRLAADRVALALGEREKATRDLRALLGELEAKNWSSLAARVRKTVGR